MVHLNFNCLCQYNPKHSSEIINTKRMMLDENQVWNDPISVVSKASEVII